MYIVLFYFLRGATRNMATRGMIKNKGRCRHYRWGVVIPRVYSEWNGGWQGEKLYGSLCKRIEIY